MKNSPGNILNYILAMSVLWILLGFYLLTMRPLWDTASSLRLFLLSLPSGYVLMDGISLIDRQLRAELGVKGNLDYKNELGMDGIKREIKFFYFKTSLMLFPVFICAYAFPDVFSYCFFWVLLGYNIFLLLLFEKFIVSTGAAL